MKYIVHVELADIVDADTPEAAQRLVSDEVDDGRYAYFMARAEPAEDAQPAPEPS